MAQGVVERLGGLAGECPAGGVRDRPGEHDRQIQAVFVAVLIHGKDSRFGVKGVEDGFDEDQINAAFHQAIQRFQVGFNQLVEIGVAVTRVVHVRADAGRTVGGTQYPCDIAGLVRRRRLVSGFTGHPGGSHIDFPRQVLHVVIGHGDGGGIEGVGLDNVSAGVQISLVKGLDPFRLRHAEQIIVALEVAWPVGKTAPPEVLLGELAALNHGAHAAIQNQDAFLQLGGQGGTHALGH